MSKSDVKKPDLITQEEFFEECEKMAGEEIFVAEALERVKKPEKNEDDFPEQL